MTEMTYRPLGSSGLMVSTVGIGCNAFGARIDADATTAVVDAAIDSGITLFDTADTYGDRPGASEELLGRALGSRREDVVVATKFGMDMRGANGPDWGARGSRRYIRKAVEASLSRLGTDWIDLYQMHRPDPVTPIEETLAALHELVLGGKVRNVANWVAQTSGFERFVSAQNKYSLYDRRAEAELVPAAEHVGVGILPFFPLEYGLLTGKYRRGEPAPPGARLEAQSARLESADFDRIEAIAAFAQERDLSMLEVAIGGLAAQPAVSSVIAGATRPEQVRDNARAGRWEPSAQDLVALDQATGTGRL